MKKYLLIILLLLYILLGCTSPKEKTTQPMVKDPYTAQPLDLTPTSVITIPPPAKTNSDVSNSLHLSGLASNPTLTPSLEYSPIKTSSPTTTPSSTPYPEDLLLIDKSDYWQIISVEILKEIDVLGYTISPVWHNYPITYNFLLIKFEPLSSKSLIELYTGKDMGLTFIHNGNGYVDIYVIDHEGQKFSATLIGESWLAFPIPPKKHGFTLVYKNSPPILLSEVQPLAWRLDQIYFVSERNGNPDIFSMNPDGSSQTPIINSLSIDKEPSISPDGGTILFTSDQEGDFDIFQFRLSGSILKNITNHPAEDGAPSWSPDGNQIAFHSTRNGNWDIFLMNKDGNNVKALSQDLSSEKYPSFSNNGREIAFQSDRDGNWDIFVYDTVEEKLKQISNHPAQDIRPSWSPILSRIIFWSDRDGHWRLFTLDLETMEISPITQYANPGSYISKPGWSPDGKYLLFSIIRDGNLEIFLTNHDGSDPRRLTKDYHNDYDPNW
jgi:Tol biopolymer transport system component